MTEWVVRVKKIAGEENADDQHFLLFPHCLLKDSFSLLLIFGIVCYLVNINTYFYAMVLN